LQRRRLHSRWSPIPKDAVHNDELVDLIDSERCIK
jgi:hypothetical protein